MKTRQHGFTLIELLTVIAIIAILAAILLPVLGRAREQGRRSACMSNLHQIAIGIKMYKQDTRGYPLDWPETVGGSRVIYTGDRWFGDAAKTHSGYGLATLYPDYVSNLKVFNCPNNDETNASAPAFAADEDYAHWVASGDPDNYAHYNSYDGSDPLIATVAGSGTSGETLSIGSAWKYRRSPWQSATVAGSTNQFRRMLTWRNPSEDTVITWCSQHRNDPVSGTRRTSDLDIIVYLDGSTKTVKSDPGTGESGHGSNAIGSQ